MKYLLMGIILLLLLRCFQLSYDNASLKAEIEQLMIECYEGEVL